MMTTAMTAMMMMMMMMMMMLIRVWMEDKQSGAESPGIINGITAHIDHIDHHHHKMWEKLKLGMQKGEKTGEGNKERPIEGIC